jgi:hypothetical protein
MSVVCLVFSAVTLLHRISKSDLGFEDTMLRQRQIGLAYNSTGMMECAEAALCVCEG